MIRRKRVKINIGDKFGKLKIIECIGSDRWCHKRFKVLCDCGNLKIVTGTRMISGGTKSCGCLKTLLHQKSPGSAGYRDLYRRCERGAKARNYEFCLTKEKFIEIINKNCYYCNEIPRDYNPYMKRNNKRRDPFVTEDTVKRAWIKVTGVDRLDNTKGYTVENCVPCCIQCNVIKMDYSSQEFLNRCRKIVLHHDKKHVE